MTLVATAEWDKAQQNVVLASEVAYNWALKNGIAKEQARKVLKV